MKPLKVNWNQDIGVIEKDLIYGEGKNHKYDLYLPVNIDKEKNIPLVVYIHGGGFTSGDKEQGEIWCKYFTSKGYMSASINYDIRTEEDVHYVNEMYQNTEDAVVAIIKEANIRGYNIKKMAITGE